MVQKLFTLKFIEWNLSALEWAMFSIITFQCRGNGARQYENQKSIESYLTFYDNACAWVSGLYYCRKIMCEFYIESGFSLLC